jgi:hypothetical protein
VFSLKFRDPGYQGEGEPRELPGKLAPRAASGKTKLDEDYPLLLVM